MKIIIEVNMDNASFNDNPNELGEILTQIPSNIKAGDDGVLKDSNGNKVGFWDAFESF